MSTTVTEREVTDAMHASGFSRYTPYATNVAEVINRRGRSVSDLMTFARSRGGYVQEADVQRFLTALPGGTEVEQAPASDTVEGFDRDAAAQRIREFANEAGAPPSVMARVEDLLIEVGLVDAPEPEPEPEPEQSDDAMPSWARSLLDRISAIESRITGR